jgi:hypothetical protein
MADHRSVTLVFGFLVHTTALPPPKEEPQDGRRAASGALQTVLPAGGGDRRVSLNGRVRSSDACPASRWRVTLARSLGLHGLTVQSNG